MDRRKEMDSIDVKSIDIIELITQLRNERLFVVSELKAIKAANEQVREVIDKLTQIAWINLQKRIALNMLAVSNCKVTTVKCWQNLNSLATTTFVHAKEILNDEDSTNFGELLQILRSKPEMLAHLLVLGNCENTKQDEFRSIINSITSGLYGALLLPEDVSLILGLLEHLVKLELVTSDNPRRKLRHKSCAFSQLYFLFHENLPAAKLFLITALRKPIMQVIAKEDDYFYVADPENLRQKEVEQKNNNGGNDERNDCRKDNIHQLIYLTNCFINSIRDSIFSFPGSFAWLVGHVSDLVSKTYGVNSKEVREVNTDLIFTLFICPAIVHPETYGICDVSISDVTRHNLMQVAQILQALALFKFNNEPEPKYADFYSLFEQESIYEIIEDLLNNSANEHVLSVDHVPEVARTNVFFTQEELHNLVSFLQKAMAKIELDGNGEMAEERQEDAGGPSKKYLLYQSIKRSTSMSALLRQIGSLLASLSMTVKKSLEKEKVGSSSSSSTTLILKSDKGQHTKRHITTSSNGKTKSLSPTVLVVPIHQDKIQYIGLLSEHKVIGLDTTDKDNVHDDDDDVQKEKDNCGSSMVVEEEEEEEASVVVDESARGTEVVVGGSEKRIRFSRCHDESSMGGIMGSDNLEEAASNHSVDSSVEMENEEDQDQNDNLSDMISANVSGRGTPNISGRDTPSSQVNDDEDVVGGDVPREAIAPVEREEDENEEEAVIVVREPALPPQRRQVQIMDKHAQNEIDDKFCKFEIKKMLEGEETRSIISDTWSTDVLASDCETIDGNDVVRVDQLQQNIVLLMESVGGVVIGGSSVGGSGGGGVGGSGGTTALLDMSETKSESGWSTDVLASDSERLTEVDADEIISVARLDDTASVVSRSDEVGGSGSTGVEETNSSNSIVKKENVVSKISNVLDDLPCRLTASESEDLNEEQQQQQQRGICNCQRCVLEYSVAGTNTSASTVAYQSVNNFLQDPNVSELRNEVAHAKSRPSTTKQQQEEQRLSNDSSTSNNSNTATTTSSSSNSSSSSSTSSSSRGTQNNESQTREKKKKKKKNDEEKVDVEAEEDDEGGGGGREGGEEENDVHGMLGIRKVVVPVKSFGSVLKSTSLNGAIPKTISFDVSATDKGSDDEQQKEKRSFLGKLRIGFRNRRGKTTKEVAEEVQRRHHQQVTVTDKLGQPPPASIKRTLSEDMKNNYSSFISERMLCEDILAKYRKPSDCDNNGNTSNSGRTRTGSNMKEEKDIDASTTNITTTTSTTTTSSSTNATTTTITTTNNNNNNNNSISSPLDREDSRNNLVFSNVKKKLRLVLSNSCGYHSTVRSEGSGQVKTDLESYLQLELAKAYKLNCRSSARIAEALRCIKTFDEKNCYKLCSILKEDYCQRSVYIQYLIQSRQLLLSILAFLEGLSEQIESEKDLSTCYMASICIKFFLEHHDEEMTTFRKEFSQLTLVDEKCHHLKEFLKTLNCLIRKETIWQDDIELAEVAIERAVINQVYYNALYPNGDGDKDRDTVLEEHVEKLSKVISPNHKDLMISPCFQNECPWLPAQEALKDMTSYRSPRDKFLCVLRSTLAIKDLLSLTSNKIPSADDYTPILVYVVIKANPPNLLSTIQYINGFSGDWLRGEDLYWWTQFCAAVEFIKTMDYSD